MTAYVFALSSNTFATFDIKRADSVNIHAFIRSTALRVEQFKVCVCLCVNTATGPCTNLICSLSLSVPLWNDDGSFVCECKYFRNFCGCRV